MDIALSMVVAVAEVPRVAAVVPYMVGMAEVPYMVAAVAVLVEWEVDWAAPVDLGVVIRRQPGRR